MLKKGLEQGGLTQEQVEKIKQDEILTSLPDDETGKKANWNALPEKTRQELFNKARQAQLMDMLADAGLIATLHAVNKKK